MPLQTAVLISGSGSNLQALIDKIEEGVLDAEIKLVFSNKADAYGLKRAEKHGIPTAVLDNKDFSSRETFDTAMSNRIVDSGADTVVMAGFMRLVTPVFIGRFRNRVLNIHPALLPSFKGVHGQGDAADYGVKISGCTVHFVDEEMDHGPIVIQAAVPAEADDDGSTLGKRILTLEHRVFPQAVQWLAEDRLQVKGRKVHLLEPADGIEAAEVPCNTLIHPPLEKGF
jgi:phosphoribosylglycinamide formyltransferase-1